jgi:hypothetical protein
VGWWVGGVGEIEREKRAGDFLGGGVIVKVKPKLN